MESRSGLLGGNIIMEDVEGRDQISFTINSESGWDDPVWVGDDFIDPI